MANLYFNGPSSALYQRADSTIRYQMPVEFSYGSSSVIKPRILVAQFGDGYSQRIEDGINNLPMTISAQFQNRSEKVLIEVRNFMLGLSPYNDRRVSEYFFVQLPAETTYRKFIVAPGQNFSINYVSANNYTLQVTLEEVFDP